MAEPEKGKDTIDGDALAPKGFTGILDDDESWKLCPYDPSHRYLKATVHLVKCRDEYERKKKAKGEPMDIGICRFQWTHHIPMDKLKHHEATCDDQCMLYAYLDNYFQMRRDKEGEESDCKSVGKSKNPSS